MTLGEKIKARRKDLNMSFSDLVKKSGIAKGAVSLLENDKIKKPSFEKLEAIASALETDVYELTGIPLERKCMNCRFYDQMSNKEDIGLCHRFPPITDGKDQSVGIGFAIVRLNTWCGEWQQPSTMI